MPTRQHGRLAKNSSSLPRLSRLRSTTFPHASAPWTWKLLFAMSSPIVVICMWTSPAFVDRFTLPRWHVDAVSGRRPCHYQDRREGHQPRPLCRLPDGRGCRAEDAVRRDPAADRRSAATVAAAPGMSIAGNDRWQPDGRGASMSDRERPNAAQRRARSLMTRVDAADGAGSSPRRLAECGGTTLRLREVMLQCNRRPATRRPAKCGSGRRQRRSTPSGSPGRRERCFGGVAEGVLD